jgi:hypothetical protein
MFPPPSVRGGGYTLSWGERVPIPAREQTLWYSRNICTSSLTMVANFQAEIMIMMMIMGSIRAQAICGKNYKNAILSRADKNLTNL